MPAESLVDLNLYAAFTVGAAAGGVVCAVHAARHDRLPFFLAAVVYGLVLEKLVVLTFGTYSYPAERFLSVAGIPLAIGLGWSLVLYGGYETARAFDLPARARPAAVALYALHVDLAIDAVAIRVPYWSWTAGADWFGVPLDNYFGWVAVAAAFVAVYEVARARLDRPAVAAAVAPVGATPLLYVALEAFTGITAEVTWAELVGLGATVALAVVVVARAPRRVRRHDPEIVAVGLGVHASFLVLLFLLGIHERHPTLLAASLGMAALGAAVHLGPWLAAGRDPSATPENPPREGDPERERGDAGQ